MKRIYITAIPLDSNFAIAPYAAQAANYQQTYTAPSCYPITPIIADTARPGDEVTVLAVRQKNSPRSDNLDAFRRELDTLGTPYTLIDVTTPENQQRDALLTLFETLTDAMQDDAYQHVTPAAVSSQRKQYTALLHKMMAQMQG